MGRIYLQTMLFSLITVWAATALGSETLSGDDIVNSLTGKSIVNVEYWNQKTQDKLINEDGTWALVRPDGQLVMSGFWRVSDTGEFCQQDYPRVKAEVCLVIQKEGDFFTGSKNVRSVTGEKILKPVSRWRVVAETPAVALFKESEKYQTYIAARQRKKQYIAAYQKNYEEEYKGYIAEKKRQALKAVPAAGPNSDNR